MEKRKGKWISYFDLLDALRVPGCPLCNRVKDHSWKFLDNLFYERVTDVWTRVGLRKSKGFCNWHAWMSTEINNSNSGIAIIYKDLIDAEVEELHKWIKGKRFVRRINLGRGKRNHRTLLSAWIEKFSCPVCKLVGDHERMDAGVLLDFIDEEAFSQEFEKSSGICIRHLIRTIRNFGEHPNLPLLVEKQLEKYRFLSDELGEFIRKLDYRFSNEPKGSEVSSWKRAIEQFSGKKEVFGNEIDPYK